MQLDLTPLARKRLPPDDQHVLRLVLPDSFRLHVGLHRGGSWTARLCARRSRVPWSEVFDQPSARAAAWAAVRSVFP